MMAFALPLLLASASAPAAPTAKAEDIARMHDFSRCIVKANPNQSARILALDYRTGAYHRSLQNLATVTRQCAGRDGTLRMAGVLIAGAFAEALLPRTLAGRPLASSVAYDSASRPIEARDDGEYLGLCVVRTMPGEVSALLATAPGSDEEKMAVGAIAPRLSSCVRKGAAATLNRPALRALLALAAYRIVAHSAPKAAGGTAQ